MVIIVLVAGALNPGYAQRTEGSSIAHIPSHPLMGLPGMHAGSTGALNSLPAPLITDVINAPNPFDSRKAGLEGMTQISYNLAQDAPVTITLYDLLGRRVRDWTFHSGDAGGRQGTNQFLWDGTNEAGQKVSKGGYLAQVEVEANQSVATVLLKIGVIH